MNKTNTGLLKVVARSTKYVLAGLGMSALVACAGADPGPDGFSGFETDEFGSEVDDLVEKNTFRPGEPAVRTGREYTLSGAGTGTRACDVGGNVEVLNGNLTAATGRCIFQLIGNSLSNARMVYANGRLRGNGGSNSNAVIGGGTSFSFVRILPDGKNVNGVQSYNVFMQNSNRVLERAGGSITNFANVRVRRNTGADKMRWIFRTP